MKTEFNQQNIIVESQKVHSFRPVFMLMIRTILFGLIQSLFVLFFGMTWDEAAIWWPFSAIATNIICFFLLSHFIKKEGQTYLDLISFDRIKKRFSIKGIVWVFIIGLIAGSVGFTLSSLAMYQTVAPPDNMMSPLPIWAAITGFILFPLSNALVETPTYLGYCFPRLEKMLSSRWKAVALVTFFLAFQHFTLPISADLKFMVWHFVSMIVLAFTVTAIFIKTRNLFPIIIVHYVFDVLAIIGLLTVSI